MAAPPLPPALRAEIVREAAALAAHDPGSAGPLWGAMHKRLLKAKCDPSAVAAIVMGRDLAALDRLVRALSGDVSAAAAPAAADATRADALPEIDPDVLDSALRAFRKRLKLTRLDHESKLSVRPLTSGRRHDVDAIIPPREFPSSVWEALAHAGRLRSVGQGFYALAEEGEAPSRS